jgi:FkbH-like protein
MDELSIAHARKVVGSATLSDHRSFSLLCSFEPVVLSVYLQANLALRFPHDTPAVKTFGYNGLSAALEDSIAHPHTQLEFLLLTWEDLHPGLSWRTRRPFAPVSAEEMASAATGLRELLSRWVQQRHGSPTYVSGPPAAWLPLLESHDPRTVSPTAIAATRLLAEILQMLSDNGARILAVAANDLNLRDLLIAGCPLSRADSALLASRLVEVAYPIEDPKKVLILDLDNTLWAGTLDEDSEVTCDTSGPGYPFYVLQQFVKKLSSQGVLLGLCSRNLHDDVAARFDTMEMPLRLADFSATRINLDSKITNIVEICNELNVLPEAVVFVDDNHAQLAEVRAQLPDVECLQTPTEGAGWLSLFDRLQRHFAKWELTQEDALRTKTVVRTAAPKTHAPFGHLRSLSPQIFLEDNAGSASRSRELLNKTNQFNMTGKRWSEDEWNARPSSDFCASAKVADSYGEFGSICVAVGRIDHSRNLSWIENLVLSCRAFGYGVEYAMLAHLAGKDGVEFVEGKWIDTTRNATARSFLEGLHAQFSPDGTWRVAASAVKTAYDEFLDQSGAEVSVVQAAHA